MSENLYEYENECNFPYELTQNNINEVVALLSSMTSADWEKLSEDVKDGLISDGNGSFFLMV